MWLTKLQSIDRRIIYTILLVALFIPMARPLGIPLSVSSMTQQVFDVVENLNPETDAVLFVMDYSVGGQADVHPQAVVVAKHLASRKIPIIMVSFVDSGPMFAEQIITTLGDRVTYGVDIVNVGFLAGQETAVKRYVEDPRGTFVTDYRGSNLLNMPIMQNIHDIRDFGFIIDFQTGNPGYQEFLRQLPTSSRYAAGIVTVSVPNVMPYLNSGQLTGMLAGLRGAAEYEVLLKEPGEGAARMDAQSLGHLIIIAFIVVGNLAYFLGKKMENKQA